jgi:hypothetical protein
VNVAAIILLSIPLAMHTIIVRGHVFKIIDIRRLEVGKKYKLSVCIVEGQSLVGIVILESIVPINATMRIE